MEAAPEQLRVERARLGLPEVVLLILFPQAPPVPGSKQVWGGAAAAS